MLIAEGIELLHSIDIRPPSQISVFHPSNPVTLDCQELVLTSKDVDMKTHYTHYRALRISCSEFESYRILLFRAKNKLHWLFLGL